MPTTLRATFIPSLTAVPTGRTLGHVPCTRGAEGLFSHVSSHSSMGGWALPHPAPLSTIVCDTLLHCWELSAQPFRACIVGELTAQSLDVRACVWVPCRGVPCAASTILLSATILLSTTILQAVAMHQHVLWELPARPLRIHQSGELTAQPMCIPGRVLHLLRGLCLPLALCSMVLQACLHCIIMHCLAQVTICRPVA